MESVLPKKVYDVSFGSGNVVTGAVLEQARSESRTRISDEIQIADPEAVPLGKAVTEPVAVDPESGFLKVKTVVASAVTPFASFTVNRTFRIPEVMKECFGFTSVDVVPSSNVQRYAYGPMPPVSVLANWTSAGAVLSNELARMERERLLGRGVVPIISTMETVLETAWVTVSVTVSVTVQVPSFLRSKFSKQAPVAVIRTPSLALTKSQL